MKLYQREGSPVWQCDARAEGFGRFSTKETDKKLAKIAALNIITSTSKVVPLRSRGGMTLGDAFDRAQRNEWKSRPAQSSIAANIRYVITYFGSDRDISSLTQRDIGDFKVWLNQQPTIKTVSTRNKKLLALSSVLKLARDQWGIAGIPQLNYGIEKSKAQRKFIYSDDQLMAIAAHFNSRGDVYMADLTTYLGQTGKRLSEALRLLQGHIRMDAGLVDVWESKGDEPRSVPITTAVREILVRRQFMEQPFGELAIHQIETRWRSMRREIGLPDGANIHALRHTYATRMCESGVDIQVVQRLLGHRQISTTTIYAKMTGERIRDAGQRFQADHCDKSVPKSVSKVCQSA